MQAVLIGRTEIDFGKFLIGTNEVTGKELAREADRSPRTLTTTEKYVWCLANLCDCPQKASHLASHVSLTFMIAIPQYEVDDVISKLGNIAVLSVDGLLIATGTLQQWKECDYSGTIWNEIQDQISQEIR